MRRILRFAASVAVFVVALLIFGGIVEWLLGKIAVPEVIAAILYVPAGVLAFGVARSVWGTMAWGNDLRLVRTTTRNLAQTYIGLRLMHPEASDRDLFEQIVVGLIAVPTGGEMSRTLEMHKAAVEATSAPEFIARLVVTGLVSILTDWGRKGQEVGRRFAHDFSAVTYDELRKVFPSSPMKQG